MKQHDTHKHINKLFSGQRGFEGGLVKRLAILNDRIKLINVGEPESNSKETSSKQTQSIKPAKKKGRNRKATKR